MQKILATLLLFLFSLAFAQAQTAKANIITSDIDNFWAAYDKIITTRDTLQQMAYLNEMYIKKGSDGLKTIMEVKNYTPKAYLEAINNYPLFWQSVRANTYKSKQISTEINAGIEQLRAAYPAFRPAPIYFTMGLFRTNGKAEQGKVLIGTEMALMDTTMNIKELPDELAHVRTYIKENPIKNIVLLSVHESVHTQQKEIVENLLCASLYEGVGEFVSTKVTGRPSTAPAIPFGSANEAAVKAQFEADIFIPSKLYSWLWGTPKNQFKVRDLGYYIGYAICERYYNAAKDKQAALKKMIELDYTNDAEIEDFVDKTKFFSCSIKKLNQKFEKSRPKVVRIEQFKNGAKNVNPALKQITLHFSEPMNKDRRGFDFGPLGEKNVLSVQKVIGFSEDGKSFTFEIALKPNQQYQSLVTNAFRSLTGIPLKPFLIDIKTK
jgi:Bacterial Ig-like domain